MYSDHGAFDFYGLCVLSSTLPIQSFFAEYKKQLFVEALIQGNILAQVYNTTPFLQSLSENHFTTMTHVLCLCTKSLQWNFAIPDTSGVMGCPTF